MARIAMPSRVFQLFALMISLILLLNHLDLTKKNSQDWRLSSWLKRRSINCLAFQSDCDPYLQLGHLFTSDKLHQSRYIIYNDQALINLNAPSVDWVVPSISALIYEKKFSQLDYLRNRTILMIGDSIDRNLVTHFGRHILPHGSHQIFIPPDHSNIPTPKLDSHQIGVAHALDLNFTIYNWFLMGLAVQDPVPFFHPREDLPQEFKSRLETFFLPLIRQNLLPLPDLIIFNTGFWDLEYLARSRLARFKLQNFASRSQEAPTSLPLGNWGDGNPLSLNELAYHRMRLRSFIRFLQSSFQSLNSQLGQPIKPIQFMYRSMQLGNASQSNAFNAERVRQLDESNRIVVKEFHIPIIEWGKMTIGLNWQLSDPSIHFGQGSAQFIFGDMLLFYLKRLLLGTKDEWVGCDWIRHRELLQNDLHQLT
ncbi:hypothetical protein O181_091989 [Austropuccinia psidii MF-1]|uniref:SGNH hydrolase-type esterase domain-containing protein n=1 Tax=Austropuccinia psidii MF-1 TaxID=1389203 RepID=A0A9Q3P8F3_9BASI|nr:hypothetical protein [Austropuccinia psidii MF-1]